jgi:hypothetical protein
MAPPAASLFNTLPQSRLEVDRPAVLAEKIGEGFVGQLLEVRPTIASAARMSPVNTRPRPGKMLRSSL